MNWAILVVAGIFEVGWAIGLKYTEGFTRLWPSVWTVLAMIISLGLLGIAMKTLPVGTAYSVWVGVGAVGTVILGIVLLGESASMSSLTTLPATRPLNVSPIPTSKMISAGTRESTHPRITAAGYWPAALERFSAK